MYTLRPYQEPIAQKVIDYIAKNPNKHPLIAMPTGSGKTVVLADIILKLLEKNNDYKILVLSHVKEILEQDVEAIKNHVDPNVGVYSAGLDSKEIRQITVAGIQSAYSMASLFKDFNIVIVDECHLIPNRDDSMYRTFLSVAGIDNVIGLTATPFRLGTGRIYGSEGCIFDDLIYDLTSRDKFNDLVDQGYLSKLRTRATVNELDTSDIRTVGGDFDLKGMANKFDRVGITNACVKEIIVSGANYKKWLIFAIDIDHAEHIAETLIRSGIPSAVVHSKMDADRDDVIKQFKSGFYRAVVNVDILTTGFNVPDVDLVALLRPTKSPVIHVQTIGRGTRVAPNKDHCLVLDFAGNTERLGPINDIHVNRKRKGTGGEPITKRCPDCDTIHHPSVRVCNFCGHKFVFKTDLNPLGGVTDVVMTQKEHWFNVGKVMYQEYKKRNSPPMLKVTYICGLRAFSEYVCLEHPGYAGHKGKHWVKYRGGIGQTVEQVLKEKLSQPTRIKVNTSQKYPIITDFSFDKALLSA